MEKDGESIFSIYDRFTNIINNLKALGKDYSLEEMVRKFLRVLPRSWQPKVTALTQTDLKRLTLDELYGSLLTLEMDMKVFEEDEEEDKKKRRVVAFTSVKEVSDSEESSSSDEDMAMLAKRFNKFLKKKGGRKFQKFRKEESLKKKEEVICYECNKPGHIKPDCPRLKKPQYFKKKDGKKAMVAATWSDDESSESECEEVANLCFMAIDSNSNEVSSSSNDSIEESFTKEELHDALEELHFEFKKYRSKSKEIKKLYNSLVDEHNALKIEHGKCNTHISSVKKENDAL
ncbi:hypothetical protein, partial [Bartonella sp. AC134YNZD]|uniref:hypothetical protein n=1 Tax=Bartonella sp. AC134YNZD TaxID=3243446 RepID=UPI0035CFA4E2